MFSILPNGPTHWSKSPIMVHKGYGKSLLQKQLGSGLANGVFSALGVEYETVDLVGVLRQTLSFLPDCTLRVLLPYPWATIPRNLPQPGPDQTRQSLSITTFPLNVSDSGTGQAAWAGSSLMTPHRCSSVNTMKPSMPYKVDALLGTISGIFHTINKSIPCTVFVGGIPETMELGDSF